MSGPGPREAGARQRAVGAQLLVRVARRPRPPGRGELARLGAVVDQIPRRSALAARRRFRLAAGAALVVVMGSLGTAVWAWRGRRGPAPAAPVVLAAGETVSLRPRPHPRAIAAPAPREQPPAVDAAKVRKTPRRRSVTGAGAPVPPHHERPAPPAAPEPGADALVREIALIDAARSDVSLSPARALAALDLHRREFPQGQLAAEREFLAVESLRRMNRTEEARRRAADLQTSYPSSSYAARASRLLRSSP